MPSKKTITKKSPSRIKKLPRRSLTNFLLGVALVFVFSMIGWSYYQSQMTTPEVNLVAVGKPTPIDENGCYLKEVQCVKAPCEPIKVCPTTTTSNTIPLDCNSWFDGCNTCQVKDGRILGCTKKVCKLNARIKPYCLQYSVASPVPTPTPQACVPNPCPPNREACKLAALPEGQVYCPVSDPVACTKDAYTCPDGTKVGRTGPKCEFVCPTATPSPSLPPSPALVMLTNFSASSPCGASHFKSYQFSCSNGIKRAFDTSICQNLSDAIAKAKEACQDPIR